MTKKSNDIIYVVSSHHALAPCAIPLPFTTPPMIITVPPPITKGTNLVCFVVLFALLLGHPR